MPGQPDPWQLLGIGMTSNRQHLHQAYLDRVRRLHPDQYWSDPAGYRRAEAHLRLVNQAYQQILASLAKPEEPEPPKCSMHQMPLRGRCRWCQSPLCPQCQGWDLELCNLHAEFQSRDRQRRRKMLVDWLPMVAGALVAKLFAVPWAWMALAGLGYMTCIGIETCLEWGWRRWQLPLSPLVGIYRLGQSIIPLYRPRKFDHLR